MVSVVEETLDELESDESEAPSIVVSARTVT